ncbi:MAG: HD domain-containing protein [Paracoccaceae bacterium]
MQDIITRARDFATVSHAGQFRKGAVPLPYITHPAEVAQLVQAFGGAEAAIAAAWLHDVIEDCGVDAEALRYRFGDTIAGVVSELSDDKSLPKLKRKWLQVVHAAHMSPDAGLVKLCDKMANVRSV